MKTNHMKLNGVVILLEQYDQCKADQDKAGRGDDENMLLLRLFTEVYIHTAHIHHKNK